MISPALLEEIAAAAQRLSEACQAAARTSETDLAGPRDGEQLSSSMPALLTQKNLAERLHCDVRTLRRWVHLGDVPAPILIGGAKRWDPEVVEGWLARRAR